MAFRIALLACALVLCLSHAAAFGGYGRYGGGGGLFAVVLRSAGVSSSAERDSVASTAAVS